MHPLAQGFWDRRTHLIWFGVSGLLATLSGVYALFYTSFAPLVVWFFVFGALILLFYTYPLKYVGIGELSIFIIWGPLMIGGVFFVLTGVWDWMVLLASIPVGLNVVTINLGKHTDKLKEDRGKGVRTLPVLVGETAARYITMAAIVLSYVILAYLVFVPRFLSPAMLLVAMAYKPARDGPPTAVEAAAGRAAARIPHLAALVLDGVLRAQPRVQQLLRARPDHRHLHPHGLPGVVGVGISGQRSAVSSWRCRDHAGPARIGKFTEREGLGVLPKPSLSDLLPLPFGEGPGVGAALHSSPSRYL